MENPNVYFIVSHPIQYFVPLYKQLARNEAINTKVFFLSDETVKGVVDKQFGVRFTWDIPLLDGYEFSFVKNSSWKPSINNGFWGVFNPGIIKDLWRLPKGMVVVSGWNYSSYWLTYLFAFLFGHNVAIRCEAPFYKETQRKGIKKHIHRFLVGKVLLNGMVDKYLYVGQQNKKFYRHFSVPEKKLFFSPYSIDNERFKSGVLQYDRREQRSKLGIGEKDYVILFTGKFAPVKRPLDLLKAFHKLNLDRKHLVLVGDGILKEEMASYISNAKLEGVHFTGFINQSELPKYYVIADVLVLCSESETWGLSVNEAMACGLPVVVSDRVGCGEDLVRDGLNGYIFSKGDVASLVRALQSVADRRDTMPAMGLESERIIRDYTIEKSAEGIVLAAMNPHSKADVTSK